MKVGASGILIDKQSISVKFMKKVYVELNGGLGNQMFQYATARAFSLRTGSELVLDSHTGFERDREYQRQYELGFLPINARIATFFERLPNWLNRINNKIFRNRLQLIRVSFYGTFIVENALKYIPELACYSIKKSVWLIGYWQCPKYFQDYSDLLHTELMPSAPNDINFIDLGKTLRETESVALGIRLYEESSDPSAHSLNGQMKTVTEINNAIANLLGSQPNAIFFVFCTHRFPVLEQLNLPESTVFLTHDDGYEGSISRLWLLAQCKHHIFTNSSYYWWGAWLSNAVHKFDKTPQLIFAADNFINTDSLYAAWEKF
jgi:hypothetical protein